MWRGGYIRSCTGCCLAVVSVTLAILLRLVLVRSFGQLPTYITFYPAVMFTGLIGGFWPGLLATVLSALAADYWAIMPQHSLSVAIAADRVGLILFSAMGLFMCWVAELYRRSKQDADSRKTQAMRAAAAAINFFPDNLKHVEGSARGQPFILGRWQAAFVGNLFGWKRKDAHERIVRRLLHQPRRCSSWTAGNIAPRSRYSANILRTRAASSALTIRCGLAPDRSTS